MTNRLLTVAALAAIAWVLAACGPAQSSEKSSAPADPAMQVVERTKANRQTYALYVWNWIRRPGEPRIEEWAAEFNDGTLHRVETPLARVIADCAALTGSQLVIPTGQLTSGPEVAKAACGINTNKPFLRTEWLGKIRTRFGEADRVRLTDAEQIRTYDVAKDGVLLRTIFRQNSADRPIVLAAETTALRDTLPDKAMFDEQSLRKSYVPDEFKRSPRPASRAPRPREISPRKHQITAR